MACFAATMLVLLMLDDPTARLALFLEAHASELEQRPVVLFDALESPAQIYGLEVQATAASDRTFLLRDQSGQWTIPAVEGRAPLRAGDIDQARVDEAAFALAMMGSVEWYAASPEALERYGVRPTPAYRIRFLARDTAGVAFLPVMLEVGSTNPDDTAYYVWPDGDNRIYLVAQQFVAPALSLLDEAELLVAATAEPHAPMDGEADGSS